MLHVIIVTELLRRNLKFFREWTAVRSLFLISSRSFDTRIVGNRRKGKRSNQFVPIYEYCCPVCKREFQSLLIKRDEEQDLVCPSCGSPNPKRLISRVVYHVSENDRLSAFDPNACQSDSFYKDTRNIGLHAKKRAHQMGVDLGEGFETKLERLRTDPGSVFEDGE